MLSDQYRASGNRRIKNAGEYYDWPPDKAPDWPTALAASDQFHNVTIERWSHAAQSGVTITRGPTSIFIYDTTDTSPNRCVLTLVVPHDRPASRTLALEVEAFLLSLGCRSLGPLPPKATRIDPTLRHRAAHAELNSVEEPDQPFGLATDTAERIHLQDEVTAAFDFMVNDYSCKLVIRAANDLVYVGRRRFLRFHLIGPRPQLDIKVGPVIFGRPMLLLGRDFEGMMKRARLLILIGLDPVTRESLRSGLARRADQIKQHLGPAYWGGKRR